MTVDHELLEKVVRAELGFGSVDEFAQRQALAIFLKKLADSEAAIARFEAKYGMTLSTFQERIVNRDDDVLRHFGIIEKEDDLFDWEVEDHSLPYYKQRVDQLSA